MLDTSQMWGRVIVYSWGDCYIGEGAKMKEYILVVDDSVTARAAAEFTLSEAGFEVKTAVNGRDGLKKVLGIHSEGDKITMIISDINMPVMDGFTFLKRLKMSAFKSIPVLVMSANPTDSKKTVGKNSGAIGWLVKPFNPTQLVTIVGKIVNGVSQ